MAAANVLRPLPITENLSTQASIFRETARDQNDFDAAMDFVIVHLAAGASLEETNAKECAWVLLAGDADLEFSETRSSVHRSSLFDEPPTTLHLGPETRVKITARGAGAEFALVRTSNDRRFAARLFHAADVVPEYRGAGLVQNAGLRNVRLIFDRSARPDANLGAGRSRELSRTLVELPSTPSRSAGNLSLSFHGSSRLRARRAWRRRPEGANGRHRVHPTWTGSRASFRPRLRNVLSVDDSSSPRKPLHWLHVR